MNNRYTTHAISIVCAAFFSYIGGYASAVNVFNNCAFHGAHFYISGQMQQPGTGTGSYEALLAAMLSQGCVVTVDAMQRHVATDPSAGDELSIYLPRIGFGSHNPLFCEPWWNDFKDFATSVDKVCLANGIRTVPELDALFASLRRETGGLREELPRVTGPSSSVLRDATDPITSEELRDFYREMGGDPDDLLSVSSERFKEPAAVSPRPSSSYTRASYRTPPAHSVSPPPAPPSFRTVPSLPPPPSSSRSSFRPSPAQSSARTQYQLALQEPPTPPRTPYTAPSGPGAPTTVTSRTFGPQSRKVETLLSSPRHTTGPLKSASSKKSVHHKLTDYPFGRAVNSILLAAKEFGDVDMYLQDPDGNKVQITGLSFSDGPSEFSHIEDFGVFHKRHGSELRRMVRTAFCAQSEYECGGVKLFTHDGRVIDASDETEYTLLHGTTSKMRALPAEKPASTVRTYKSSKAHTVGPNSRVETATTTTDGSRSHTSSRSRASKRSTTSGVSGAGKFHHSRLSGRSGPYRPSHSEIGSTRKRLDFSGASRPPRHGQLVLKGG